MECNVGSEDNRREATQFRFCARQAAAIRFIAIRAKFRPQIAASTGTFLKAEGGILLLKAKERPMSAIIERLFRLRLASSISVDAAELRERRIEEVRALLAEIAKPAAGVQHGDDWGEFQVDETEFCFK